MTRPLTCLTLIAAAGAGLYLYQEKHRAQMMDREINRVVHATEQTRDRVGMMRAEWALLNEPDRLAGLAAQHLSLQTMTPGQFVQLADLGSHLPPVGAPSMPPPAIEPPAPIMAPIAAVTPSAPSKVEQAKLDSQKPVPLPMITQAVPKPEPAKPAPLPLPLVAQSFQTQPGPAPILTQRPAAPLMVQAKLPPSPPRPMQMAAARPAEPEPVYHQVYAPVVQAFASQAPAQPIRPPMVQQAAAGLPHYSDPPPYVGSALGMARTNLAAPVPIGAPQGR